MTYAWIWVVIIGFPAMTSTGWGAEDISPSEAEIRTQLQLVLAHDCHQEHNEITGEPKEEEIFWKAPVLAIKVFRSFEQDASACVRYYVYMMESALVRYASLSESQRRELRQQLLKRLIPAACTDPDNTNVAHFSGIIGGLLRDVDFPEETIPYIRKHLATAHPRSEIIRLAGIANLTDQIPRLTALRMSDETYAALADEDGVVSALFDEPGWNARLALARMGSQEDIHFCIEKIEATQDIFVRVVVLLDDYGYIRQPETIRLLQQYLESDKQVFEGDQSSMYAGYALKVLRETIEGFPTEGGFDRARSWMRGQKTFRFKR